MRALLLLLSGFAVVALAFWAYHENYATQQALREASRLQAEVRELREAIGVHRAEWAYLNRPDRLSALILANFSDLQLLPMAPAQFALLSQLPLAPESGPEPGPEPEPAPEVGP
jgi:hypothetical protein